LVWVCYCPSSLPSLHPLALLQRASKVVSDWFSNRVALFSITTVSSGSMVVPCWCRSSRFCGKCLVISV
jgi:hypothetical protein